MTDPFQLDDSLVYLNHAAVAPWPLETARAIRAFCDENTRLGAARYPQWLEVEAELKHKCCKLIKAGSIDDIALLKSTSEGLSFIAHGLSWQPGDNIVIPAEEFPSNRIVWQSLQPRGVELRQVAITDSPEPEQALIAAMDDYTRVLSVSSVQYVSGLRLDLTVLGAACRERDILFCVDAIQSLGALDFDVEAAAADFVVADGHKWMLGPEGLALFYCRDSVRERLELHEFGWHMVQQPFDFDRPDWHPAASARRFECGSPNMLGIFGLNASLGVLLDTGLDQVEQAVLQKSRYLSEHLESMAGISLNPPLAPDRRSGIVNFRLKNDQTETLHQHLMQAGVICALRGGGVRLSPHFYTPEHKLDRALELISQYGA